MPRCAVIGILLVPTYTGVSALRAPCIRTVAGFLDVPKEAFEFSVVFSDADALEDVAVPEDW